MFYSCSQAGVKGRKKPVLNGTLRADLVPWQTCSYLFPRFKLEVGPTLVIACDALGLKWLCTRFLELSASSYGAFLIGDGNPIGSDDRCHLVVATTARDNADDVHRQGQEFSWTISKEVAVDVAEKLSVMMFANNPCHQYFGRGGAPYQTVVVSRGEEPADLLRRMRDDSAL